MPAPTPENMDPPLYGFQWNQSVVDRRIERGMFSILARDRHGQMRMLGTGFVVASDGALAIGCTAAHVLSAIREARQLNRAHPSTPEVFLPPPQPIDISLEGLTLVMADGDRPQFMRVLGLAFDRRSDVALLQFAVQANGERELDAEFLADDRLPTEGDLVSVITYGDLGTGVSDDGAFTLTRRSLVRVGRVVQVHPEGFGRSRVWSVETTIPIYHGMSGSPVFLHVEPGTRLRAFGFVTTDLDDDGPQKDDRTIAGRSILAKLPCIVLSESATGIREVEFAFETTDAVGEFRALSNFGGIAI